LRAPLLEALAFLGDALPEEEVPPHAIVNWAHYVSRIVQGNPEGALPWLERFVNTEIGVDTAEVFIAKFHDRPLQLESIRYAASQLEAGHPLRGGADRLQARLAAGAS
jgi:hypothetical protein